MLVFGRKKGENIYVEKIQKQLMRKEKKKTEEMTEKKDGTGDDHL